MSPEQIQQIIDSIMTTGEFLATEAFRIAMKQVQLKLILDSVFMLIFGILSARSWLYAKSQFKSFQKYLEEGNGSTSSDEDKIEARAYTFLIISAILGLLAIIDLGYVISYALNPEWYAINLMLQLVK